MEKPATNNMRTLLMYWEQRPVRAEKAATNKMRTENLGDVNDTQKTKYSANLTLQFAEVTSTARVLEGGNPNRISIYIIKN
jgi:hypothetical protein